MIRITIYLLSFLFLFTFSSAAWAKELTKTFVASDGVTMVLIPGGSFSMGSSDEDISDTNIKHRINLSPFYMDEHTVTNRQFVKFLNFVKPSEGKGKMRQQWIVTRDDILLDERSKWWPAEIGYERKKYIAYEGFEDYPVYSVSWVAADKYCRWAGKRLSTEAEWEKAARGGLKNKQFPWGDEIPTQGVSFNKVWINNEAPSPVSPAKSHMPNGYGLYNMAGNLWEWCSDWFDPFYMSQRDTPTKDPKGPETGSQKVLRGGSWFNAPNTLRLALRNFSEHIALDETIGFRCVADSARVEVSVKDK
jgi:sulfatase modifying factor 1